MILSNSLKSLLLVVGFLSLSLAPAALAQETGGGLQPKSQQWISDFTNDGAPAAGQAQSTPPASTPSPQSSVPEAPQPQSPPNSPTEDSLTKQQKAEKQVKQEEHQRILGIVPNFNVTYLGENTLPLTPGQKFNLSIHSALDPFTFFAAAIDAGYSQATDAFDGWQGFGGYAKTFGASYVDNFDGTILGNGLFPMLLRQDPRYYRMGYGSFTRRLFYSMATTIWCRSDKGKFGPNYSNVLGNLTAGGISNLYYPKADRGAELTFQRGFTVTAEGTIGAVFDEFWPDIAKKVLKDRMKRYQPNISPPPDTGKPAPIFPH